jgi:hypothetical protein
MRRQLRLVAPEPVADPLALVEAELRAAFAELAAVQVELRRVERRVGAARDAYQGAHGLQMKPRLELLATRFAPPAIAQVPA